MTHQSDVLIAGAGIFGLAAALELRARGCKVSVIDPGPIPHPLAASTDISKVVRRAYGSDIEYMQLGALAVDGWLRWNTEYFGTELFHPVGVAYLTRTPMRSGGFEHISYTLIQESGGSVRRLQSTEIQAHYPAFSDVFVDGFVTLSDGYAESGEVITRLTVLAEAQGVRMHPGQQAASLIRHNGRVLGIRTTDGREFRADYTVIASGVWTPLLVPEVAPYIRTTGHPVFHLQPSDPDLFDASRFPVWSDDESVSGWYGFPLHPKAGVVKVAYHGDGRLTHPVTGERVVTQAQEQMLRDFLKGAIPALANAPVVYTRLCLYCDTLDQHFWIDRSPDTEGLIVATGGSGHAFKFGPVLGWLIADAVEGKPNDFSHKFRWRHLDPDTEGQERRRFKDTSEMQGD